MVLMGTSENLCWYGMTNIFEDFDSNAIWRKQVQSCKGEKGDKEKISYG